MLSIGNVVEFQYHWKGDELPVTYEQDLDEYLFDYSASPSEEEFNQKSKFAIPRYLVKKSADLEVGLSSGKLVRYDKLTSAGEAYLVKLPESERSKNKALVARNLRLKNGDEWIKVESFHLFSTKDIFEIRKSVAENDPEFSGLCEIFHPSSDGRNTFINLLALESFFYMGGY